MGLIKSHSILALQPPIAVNVNSLTLTLSIVLIKPVLSKAALSYALRLF